MFESGNSQATTSVFSVSPFNNPVTPETLKDFKLNTFDLDGNKIAEDDDIELGGVVQPTGFK